MDLDASIKKLNGFMADMHELFPGGSEGLKAMAAQKRAGDRPEPIADMELAAPNQDPMLHPATRERFEEILQLGDRLQSMLPEVETLLAGFDGLVGRLASIEDAVTALEQAKDHSPAPGEPLGGAPETGGAVAAEPPGASQAAPQPG